MSTLSLQLVRIRRIRSLPLASAVVVGLATFGCSTLDSGAQTAPPVSFTCHSAQQCRVPVVVDCTASGCAITSPVRSENVDVNGFDVVWEIVPKAGQSYAFKDPGGIFFKTSEGAQAFACHAEANGKRFSCHGSRNGRPYEYGIELLGAPPVGRLDPWIVNR